MGYATNAHSNDSFKSDVIRKDVKLMETTFSNRIAVLECQVCMETVVQCGICSFVFLINSPISTTKP